MAAAQGLEEPQQRWETDAADGGDVLPSFTAGIDLSDFDRDEPPVRSRPKRQEHPCGARAKAVRGILKGRLGRAGDGERRAAVGELHHRADARAGQEDAGAGQEPDATGPPARRAPRPPPSAGFCLVRLVLLVLRRRCRRRRRRRLLLPPSATSIFLISHHRMSLHFEVSSRRGRGQINDTIICDESAPDGRKFKCSVPGCGPPWGVRTRRPRNDD